MNKGKEGFGLFKHTHCIGSTHIFKTEEQNTEAENNLTDIFLSLFFAKQRHYHTHENADIRQRFHLKRNQNCRYGRTDISTDNNAGCLSQIHNSCVQKAHKHNGCCT